MSTHALIGALLPSGQVRAIYCHSDGYPEHAGDLLASNYATPARVAALLDLGDLSILAPALAPAAGQAHSFGQRAPGVCLAYGRDRGEPDTRAAVYPDPASFWADAVGAGGAASFGYLFCPVAGWWARSHARPDVDAPLALLLESLAAT